ncbi:tyramine receptor Ser-2-like [Lytechinus variegatus]|uniref:tyramine receptor Ser-2-like n=1 Tax=Lytechinus variegatus TaxID=7654 RepID=UPI001BB19897|nr:tyramine receptor Ser-2-like [Lytechinus variegatus]XP_041469656.1 tyramine receptor Ser-2-like [Lytechinus variegatus]XP_041469657.1 tyramine receptor Ser-2-like [Lytechinus variegatus]
MKQLHLSSSHTNLSEDRAIVIIMQESTVTPTSHLLPSNSTSQDIPTTLFTESEDSEWSFQSYIALGIIFVLMTITFIGNILIIVSVAKFKRLQIPPNYILVNLAVADLGVAIMTLLLFAFNFLSETGGVLCLLPYCFMSLFSGVSVLSLSIIAYDRYSALVEPLKYSARITSFHIAVICLVVWIYVTIISVIPMIGWVIPLPGTSMDMLCSLNFYHNYTSLAQVIAIFLPALVCMFFCYCRVMLVARHHTRAISAVQFSLFPGAIKNYNTFKGSKYWKTLALILGVFTLTWGTFITTVIVEVFCKACAQFLTMHNYSGLLLLLNSCLNPWIYAFRNQDFRAAFRRILRCFWRPCKKGSKRSNSSSVNERRNSRMSVALSRTNSLCGNLQTLQMLYEQEMALKNNNQPNFKDGEVETRHTSIGNSKTSVEKEEVTEPHVPSREDQVSPREPMQIQEA